MGGIPSETAPRARLAARLPLLLRLAHLEQLLGGEGTDRGNGADDKDDYDDTERFSLWKARWRAEEFLIIIITIVIT